MTALPLSCPVYYDKIVQVSTESLGNHSPDLLCSDFAETFSLEFVGPTLLG